MRAASFASKMVSSTTAKKSATLNAGRRASAPPLPGKALEEGLNDEKHLSHFEDGRRGVAAKRIALGTYNVGHHHRRRGCHRDDGNWPRVLDSGQTNDRQHGSE